jgi:Predicted NADH:ubiquinone oxidoreductase, subunit RnfD
MRRPFLVLAVLCLAWSRQASAQITTIPVTLGKPVDTLLKLSDLDQLTTLYGSGDWRELQIATRKLVDAAAAAAKPESKEIGDALDYARHYLIVTWLGTDPFGKAMLARVVVHVPSTSEPFSPDLPGVGEKGDGAQVYQVFFSRGGRGKIASVYVSTRDKNPFLEELPAFVQAIASPLFATVGALAGTERTRARPRMRGGVEPEMSKPPSVFASVAAVGLPFARATIKWKALAREPVEIDTLWDDAEAFARDLTFAQPATAACARGSIESLRDAFKGAAAEKECAGADATTATCQTHIDQAIGEAVRTRAASPACTAASNDDLSAFESVEKKFRDFAGTGMTSSAEADITFKNRPLTHWSFGAGSGVLTTVSLTLPRVTVDDHKLAADPLGRVVTTSFVNWSPSGYDAEQARIAGAERLRPFFGVTMTPDFGLAAGVNVLLTRGIGVSAGGVVMFAQGAPADRIGSEPADPDKPYRISYARGILVGITYNFK